MSDKGTFIVTIEDNQLTGDNDRTIVRRFEGTDEEVEELALRLEALVEERWIESYSIKGQALPPLATVDGIYKAIVTEFWHSDVAFTILGDNDRKDILKAWRSGWRNRDYYFTRNAKANIR